jgi:hypothetical protein
VSAGTGVWSAVIAAATSLVVFGLTQFAAGRRERHTRADDHRRNALQAAQEAALALRAALADYGPMARSTLGGTPGSALAAARQRTDDAFATLDVRLTRLADPGVQSTITSWRDRARYHYISAEEVTTAEEAALWRAMNDAIAHALRD